MTTPNPALQTLEHAMNPIIEEMFQNGPEEGCRLWEDYSHPLHQAIQILVNARAELHQKELAMLIEQHRRMEEGI